MRSPRSYGGDPNDLTSTSTALAVKVGRFHSSTTVIVSANPSVFVQVVTLTATISGVGKGATIPTGSATFMDGIVKLGTAKLTTVKGVTKAVLNTSSLALGNHAITVIYAGDANDISSTSAPMNVTVNKDSSVTGLVSSGS